MRFLQLLMVILLAIAIGLGIARYAPLPVVEPIKETRLDQIKRTGVLRCGYSIWPPALTRDPNTGAFQGLFFDLMEEMGKQLNLKIEWTTEVSPAHMFTDLDAGRYDMVCSSFIATPARAKAGAFSIPIFYNALRLYARADDTRFDDMATNPNNADVTFAVVDGGISAIMAAQRFPLAQRPALPELSSPADAFLYVAAGKADLTISEPLTFALFDKNNPGRIKLVYGEPLQVLGGRMPLPTKEHDLKNMIDATLTHLHDTGVIEALLTKHEPEKARFIRAALPYIQPNTRPAP